MRIFLDTNVLVSAFTTRGICADVVTVALAEHELVVGNTVLTELGRVLRRKMKMPRTAIEETEDFIRREATIVSAKPDPTLPEVRDPGDLKVLAEAIAGGADVLVSGDRDLLDVASELPLEVLSPRGFWEKLHRRR